MLIIRKEQTKAFEQSAIKNFTDQMVIHLKQLFPGSSKLIGEKSIREVIRLGIERSAIYGLTNRGPVRFYIEQMFILGSYFDTDPQVPCAADILKDITIIDQMERACFLHKNIKDYVNKVSGPANVYKVSAMKGIRLCIEKSPSTSLENFEGVLLSEMQRIYPQKYEYLGNFPLQTLIREGIESAKSYSIQTIEGISFFIFLMFALGHRFIEDPLFPSFSWILNDSKCYSSDDCDEKVKNKAIAYFDQILAVLEKGK